MTTRKRCFFRCACAACILPCRALFADERGNRFRGYRCSIIDGTPETHTLCLRQTFSVLWPWYSFRGDFPHWCQIEGQFRSIGTGSFYWQYITNLPNPVKHSGGVGENAGFLRFFVRPVKKVNRSFGVIKTLLKGILALFWGGSKVYFILFVYWAGLSPIMGYSTNSTRSIFFHLSEISFPI